MFICSYTDRTACAAQQPPFEWVVENVFKNADAMDGEGTITVDIIPAGKKVLIDI